MNCKVFREQHRGFGLIELLISVSVIAVLSALVYGTFFDTGRTQALDKDTAVVLSAIERARSLTLSSLGDRQYGIHLEANRVVIFGGSSYNASDPSNRVEPLSSLVRIASTSLVGGGADILFERLTGKTAQSGTVTLELISDPSRTKIITIEGTGIVERN